MKDTAIEIVRSFLNLQNHSEFNHVLIINERACEICKLRNRARKLLKQEEILNNKKSEEQ